MEADESFDGRGLELRIGGELRLSLKENPTTGFRWVADSLADTVCRLDGDDFENVPTARGSGGTHRWHFHATRRGTGTLRFSYRRPWEQAAALRTFTLTIRVS